MNNYGAQNMVACLKKVLMKRPQKFMSKVDLQKWNYTSPLDQDFINENYNEFYKIIKNSGAEIVDLKLINENAELCDSIFTHDPYFFNFLKVSPYKSWVTTSDFKFLFL